MDILLAAFVNSSQEVERNTHPPRWQKKSSSSVSSAASFGLSNLLYEWQNYFIVTGWVRANL